jgi:two-component system phosphate regulon response regulator PhoB
LARDWQPDLILLDVDLPKVDGGTIVRKLRGEPATAEVPIVLMSAARTFRELNASDQLHGADAALVKPFDIEALLTQVAFYLARRAPSAEETDEPLPAAHPRHADEPGQPDGEGEPD